MQVDKINSLFELAGAIVTWMNVYNLYKDKKVLGINYVSVIVFSLIGIWHLCYYSNLSQSLSFYAGCALVCGNISWVILLLIFKIVYKNS